MRNILFILLCVSLRPVFVFSQQSLVDSIKHVIQNYPKRDSQYVWLMAELSYAQRNVSIPEALNTLQETYPLAHSLNNDYLDVLLLYNMGDIHSMLNAQQEAYTNLNKALEIAKKHHTESWYNRQSKIQNLLGMVFYQSNPPLAFRYLHESIETLKKTSNKNAICGAYSNIASLYHTTKQLDSSIYYYQTALECYQHPNNSEKYYITQMYYADCLMDLKQYQKAVQLLQESAHNFKKNNDDFQLKQCLFYLAESYFALNDLNNAHACMERIRHMAVDFPENEKHLAELYVQWFEKNHQADSALVYLKKVQALDQEFYEQSKKDALEEQEIRYRTKEKEVQNQELAYKLERARLQNYLLYGILLVLVLLTVIITFFMSRLRKANQSIHKALDENARIEGVKQLMTKLLAHDLRAPLQTIQLNTALLKIQHPQLEPLKHLEQAAGRIHQMAQQIFEIQNQDSSQIEKKIVAFPVQRTINSVVSHFAILAESRSIRLNVQTPEIPIEAMVEPDLLENILGNLLSNAIKFAPEGSTILIESFLKEKQVTICFLDEGPGFDPNWSLSPTPNPAGWGIGLKLSQKYLEMMHGTLNIENRNPGSKVCVVLQAA